MEEGVILVQINWIYFLGIIGALICVAYYAGSKLKAVETDISWLKRGLDEIKETVKDVANNQITAKDNRSKNGELFGSASPLRLKSEGLKVLEGSGMKEYVDIHEEELHEKCGHDCDISAYEIQENVFDLFDTLEFDKETDKKLKDYAYGEGLSMETIRRIGAIYFRDKCLIKCNLKPADVDRTQPEPAVQT